MNAQVVHLVPDMISFLYSGAGGNRRVKTRRETYMEHLASAKKKILKLMMALQYNVATPVVVLD